MFPVDRATANPSLYPENGFDKEPIVTPAAARFSGFARKFRCNPLPLSVAQHQSNQG
jgi:hypothetical protein